VLKEICLIFFTKFIDKAIDINFFVCYFFYSFA